MEYYLTWVGRLKNNIYPSATSLKMFLSHYDLSSLGNAFMLCVFKFLLFN